MKPTEKRRRLAVARSCAFALLIAFAACRGDQPGAHGPEVSAPAVRAKPTVVFQTKTGEVPVVVDVARTEAQREQGLMWVDHLERGRGMLFLMGEERVHTFWMKNTYIPLDMIFLDAKREVVGVVAQAEPLTLTARRVEAPSTYVVEVAGGWAEEVGIVSGVKARFERVD